MSEQNYCLWF